MGKYEGEALKYRIIVAGVNNKIGSAFESLNKVDKELGLDPENASDLLTANVIASNANIKEEINNLISNLDNQVGPIMAKAQEIDERIKREEMEYARLLEEKIKKDQEEKSMSFSKAEKSINIMSNRNETMM